MEAHWLENLKNARDKIQVSQNYLDETISFCDLTDGTEEQLLRLSEHCSKMMKTLNVIIKMEKETASV
jgi:hypothetical protein